MDQKLESPAQSERQNALTSDKGPKVFMQIRTKVTLDIEDNEVGL